MSLEETALQRASPPQLQNAGCSNLLNQRSETGALHILGMQAAHLPKLAASGPASAEFGPTPLEFG